MQGYKGFYGIGDENIVQSYYFTFFKVGDTYKIEGSLVFGKNGGTWISFL